MAKDRVSITAVIFGLFLCCEATVVRVPDFIERLPEQDATLYQNDKQINWQQHIMDFVALVDQEKVLNTAVRFIDNPEVMKFIAFFLSPQFKDMVWEMESMDEFKEAYMYLSTKGYDLQPLIDEVNTALSLPEYNKPQIMLRTNSDVSEFLAAMFGTLPIAEMRELLKNKKENYPEVAEFVNIVKSPEFMDIIKRMLTSSKFSEFKSTFESYGVDFNFICEVFKEIAGDEYQGIVCGKEKDVTFVV